MMEEGDRGMRKEKEKEKERKEEEERTPERLMRRIMKKEITQNKDGRDEVESKSERGNAVRLCEFSEGELNHLERENEARGREEKNETKASYDSEKTADKCEDKCNWVPQS